MNLNLIVVSGRVAAEPELRTFASGATLLRLLVTVRSDEPKRRIDVLPIVFWNPGDDVLADELRRGAKVFVAGSVQRRFWSEDAGRSSRIEIVAHHVEVRTEDEATLDECSPLLSDSELGVSS